MKNVKNELFLFTTKTCPGCEIVKMLLNKKKVKFQEINATKESIEEFNLNISTVPFLIYFDDNGKPSYYDNVHAINEFILSKF